MEFKDSKEFKEHYLGKGLFGTVYRYQDKAIKQYHPYIYKFDTSNPCLKPYHLKFKLMKLKAPNIKHTFLVEDLLYINGKFSGVIYPYIEGNHLGTLLDTMSIIEKEKLSRQLIIHAKELTDNFIYPKDYRLPNILRDINGNIKIIDLDDIRTKIKLYPSPCNYMLSLNSLRQVLIDLLEDDDYFYNQTNIKLQKYNNTETLKRIPVLNYTILNNYVTDKTKAFKTMFININELTTPENINIDQIYKVSNNTECKIILITKNQNNLLIDSLLKTKIPLYDYISVSKNNTLESQIENYKLKHNIKQGIILTLDDLSIENNISFITNILNEKPQKQKIKTL